jgi:CRP-like cAMP-binding protein
MLASLPVAPLETLAREVTYRTVAAGFEIVSEGEPGDSYYAITDGEVRVTQLGTELRRMGRGEGFGEIALLHTTERTATVTALTSTTLLAIEQEAFLSALNASPKAADTARVVAQRLLANTA